MSEKNIEEYLDKGLQGAPQIKPEERQKYLGNFRERIYFALTLAEMKNEKNDMYLDKELRAEHTGQLYLNGALEIGIQSRFMQIAQKYNCHFTLVNDQAAKKESSIGLVYAADYAVNIPDIFIHDKYSHKEPEKKEQIKKKTGLFQQLFEKRREQK